jgi:ABC-2 type transport system ATP-binding protein
MSDKHLAIEVKNLYKSFKLPHEQASGLKQTLVNLARRKKGYEIQHVLNDVSFEIKKGEFFGIVGRNGSGKSTLLKLLAGIYAPDKGLVQVNGSLTPFIELGVGFNPELTGRENVFLNGALLGFSRVEMESMYDEIVDFAELDRFMDQKLKNYSSGMQVRLAFSIAIKSDTDVLIFDEVLAVGDEAFQKKCTEYFASIKKTSKTVILVTHDMSSVDKFCDRVLVLDGNKSLGIFTTSEGRKIYNQLNRRESRDADIAVPEARWGSHRIKVKSISLNGSAKNLQTLQHGGSFDITVNLQEVSLKNQKVLIGFGINDQFGSYITGPNTEGITVSSNQTITYSLQKNPLNKGTYTVEIALFNEEKTEELDHIMEAISFDIEDETDRFGKINLFGEWRIT